MRSCSQSNVWRCLQVTHCISCSHQSLRARLLELGCAPGYWRFAACGLFLCWAAISHPLWLLRSCRMPEMCHRSGRSFHHRKMSRSIAESFRHAIPQDIHCNALETPLHRCTYCGTPTRRMSRHTKRKSVLRSVPPFKCRPTSRSTGAAVSAGYEFKVANRCPVSLSLGCINQDESDNHEMPCPTRTVQSSTGDQKSLVRWGFGGTRSCIRCTMSMSQTDRWRLHKTGTKHEAGSWDDRAQQVGQADARPLSVQWFSCLRSSAPFRGRGLKLVRFASHKSLIPRNSSFPTMASRFQTI